MRLAVLRELADGETRVALVPESVRKLSGAGHGVAVETGAGAAAGFPDSAFTAAGATVITDCAQLVADAEMILKVGPPLLSPRDEVAMMRSGQYLLSSLMATRNRAAVRALATRGVTAFSTDTIPRITRAQSMDTLSSMASIAGYRGALLAALELHKYMPMFMTAAGTIPPAKVFVIGAGVAGLQAIATARRLGAQVFATDVRPEVKEQIESVGARYVGIELAQSAAAGGGYAGELSEQDKARQAELLARQCAASDAVITTALIGGVFAPRLISAAMVQTMRPGSVIVDLAADGGGNCELSQPGQTVTANGVRILAPLNLAGGMPTDASVLWSRNLTAFLLAFCKDGQFQMNLTDEILRGATITHGGQIVHDKTRQLLAAGEP